MLSAIVAAFLLSLSAIPVTHICNAVMTAQSQLFVFVIGICMLACVTLLSYLFFGLFHKIRDPFFYVFTLFSFTSIVDLIIALELDGYVEEFISYYFKEGEPYLATAHGTFINYWDGTGHYFLYLVMESLIILKQDYRDVGLFWVGSITNSLIVLILGALAGEFGNSARASIFLNVPYAMFPVVIGYCFLKRRPKRKVKNLNSRQCSIWRRPVDIFLVLCLLALTVIGIIRGLAILNSPADLPQLYQRNYEPYLADPIGFPKIQVIVYLFYSVPFYIGSMIGLINPGHEWMIDWSLICAGVAAQAQVSYMGASLHHRTKVDWRVPEDSNVFWAVNLSLLIVPQLLAWRCAQNSDFFVTFENKDKKRAKTN